MDEQTVPAGEHPVETDRLAELRSSAKGWHGVQLAVLGFIGLCGVLQDTAASAPHWLQVLAGVLVVAALVLACVATALVATAAWPLDAADRRTASTDDDLRALARRLRLGIVLTFVAVVLLALGATSSWWPETSTSRGGAESVEVTTQDGTACGPLRDGAAGAITLDTAGGLVAVPVTAVVQVRPVSSC